jgi:cytochrome P450
LVDYHQTIIEITNEYLRKWEKKESFSWYPELLDYTFDVACNFLIGLPSASETPLKDYYQTFVKGLFSLSTLPLPWTNFGKAMKSREQLLQDIEEIIVNRQEEKEKKSDALTILLSAKDEEGNNLSLAELKDQILNLLFAGHSTLASALSSFCLLIAQHPEVLANLRKEQEQIKEPISMETRPQMPYLDQVIQEVLRLIPPVGGGFRQIIQDFELNGYYFPQGWSVIYEIAETHQEPKVWPEPEDFNPDRFAFGIKPKPFTYIPFGGGMRECLGKELAKLEMKIFTALLVRNYQWSLLPNQDLSLQLVPFPRPKDNLQVEFYRRDHG